MRGAPIATLLLLACGRGPVETPDPQLPDDTDAPPEEPPAEPPLPDDTGFGQPEDPAPDHWLHARHAGTWNLAGSPYSTLTGTLTITEVVDDPVDPDTADTATPYDCRAVYDVIGSPPADLEGCADCDALFEVTFLLTQGDPSACLLPDLPADGEVRRMGWSSARSAILLDYRDSGIFLPWYPATLAADVLTIEWAADLGLVLEEEEEE